MVQRKQLPIHSCNEGIEMKQYPNVLNVYRMFGFIFLPNLLRRMDESICINYVKFLNIKLPPSVS